MRRLLRRLAPTALVSHLDLGRWLALAAVGVTAIAVWGLPPRTREYVVNYRMETPTPSELELRAVRRDAVRENASRVREAWLTEMDRSMAETGPSSVALWLPESLPADMSARLAMVLNDGLKELAPAGPQMSVGFANVRKNQGGHPALDRLDPYGATETYLGHNDQGAYCYTVRVSPADGVETWIEGILESEEKNRRAIRALGVCGFFAKYGAPGSNVDQWFRAGGHHYAQFVFVDQFPRMGFIAARGRFGINERGIGLPKQACAAGSKDACEGLFLEPVSRNPRLVRVWNMSRRPPHAAFNDMGSGWFNVALLGWLEKEFGEESFRDFWTSDLEVREAFETAFPVTLEEWVRDMTVRTVGPVRPGPALTVANAVGSFVFLLLGAVISLFVARRANPARR